MKHSAWAFRFAKASGWAGLRRFRSPICWFMLVLFLHLAVGCNYYMVKQAPATGATVEHSKQSRKYIIVHQGGNAWHLKDIVVDEEKKEIRGDFAPVSQWQQHYREAKPHSPNRYRTAQGNPTYEVHLYIAEYAEAENGRIIIPLSSLNKIEVYDQDLGATVASHLFSGIGILVAAYVLMIIIILLTKSSCPFVYTSNGHGYHFAGELYGGAIYSSLERDDYLPLPGFAAHNGHYQLRISNELLERQYTDLAQLLVAEHPEHAQVLIDRYGKLHTLANPVAPAKAVSETGTDFTATLAARDSSRYLFSEQPEPSKELSQLVLSFPKPAGATTAKLVLNAKNSLWLDYLYGKFNEQFGTYFNTFAGKQKKVPAEKNIQWAIEQGIPLLVYLETRNGWELVDYFNTPGPLASRDLVMPIDLSRATGSQVRLKLECGYMFWEVDYAALDFSEAVPVHLSRLSPATAVDETGADVAALLSAADKKYLEQPDVGNQVVVRYPAPQPAANTRQTVFLHSRGYYEYIRDYQNKPNLVRLNSFKKQGALPRFSKELYRSFAESKNIVTNAFAQHDAH